MKTKTTFFSLLLLLGIICSCTPNDIVSESDVQKSPTIFSTGGEQSAEPDNEKD
jgi:hypothetical protein